MNVSSDNLNVQEFSITRTFDAPRDLVWKVYTEAEHLAKWWGPKGFGIRVAQLDLQPGGVFHYGMQLPDGKEVWGKFVYREIVAPERLCFVVSFSDENCGITRHFMSASWPLEVFNSVTFDEKNGKTTLIMKGYPINATEEERKTFESSFEGMRQGFSGTLDQLDAYLSSVLN